MKNLEPRRARWLRMRLALLAGGLALGCARLVHAAYELQVARHDELTQEALNQYTRQVEVSPRRGTIYDRNHNALAVSVGSPSLMANPRRLAQRRGLDLGLLAARLSQTLHVPAALVEQRLRSPRGFVWLKRHLSQPELAAVRALMTELRLGPREGMEVLEESRRWYPNRELAAHVLGFVSTDGRGLEGLERFHDERLRGHIYSVQGLRDAHGNLVFADGVMPGEGQSGDDLTLTLDMTLQHIAERHLAAACQTFEARGGSIVVLQPDTGEVLAMASYPTYNPNEASTSDPDARRNRPLADRFEPGSTMKVFSVAGALDAGRVDAGQLIDCHGGTYTVGDLTIHDAHPDTWLTPMQILARSSNIGAAQIGAALGSDGLERAYRRFGFGERTGLPLPGEARARFGERRWYEVEVATVAFGQGVSVTSVQLAQGLAAVANGGRLVRPLLVRRITDATGALVEEQPPDPGRPALRPGMARLLAEMLTAVTEPGGTGIEAAIPGVPVAGKTGTAQKANIHGRGYDDSRWTSSFIGFVPADHPRLVITVVIDEPQPAHSGGAVAAPVFRRIAEDSLRYLGALPAHGAALATARLPTSQDRDATRDVGPTGAITAAPTRHAQPGDGVPELLGRSARAAVATLAARGLEAVVDGSGEVVRQDPPAGSPVPGDRRVRVWLEPGGRYTPAVEETAEEP